VHGWTSCDPHRVSLAYMVDGARGRASGSLSDLPTNGMMTPETVPSLPTTEPWGVPPLSRLTDGPLFLIDKPRFAVDRRAFH
jgi:hypothetical protein